MRNLVGITVVTALIFRGITVTVRGWAEIVLIQIENLAKQVSCFVWMEKIFQA